MIFILKTYTTTSIEYNVIQLMFSKDMVAQPRQVSNLIPLFSTVYIPSPNPDANTIRSKNPIRIRWWWQYRDWEYIVGDYVLNLWECLTSKSVQMRDCDRFYGNSFFTFIHGSPWNRRMMRLLFAHTFTGSDDLVRMNSNAGLSFSFWSYFRYFPWLKDKITHNVNDDPCS